MALDFNDAPSQPRFEDAESRRDRIKAGLQSRVRDVVRYLFSQAAMRGDTARIGNLHGDRGESLAIALSPPEKAGMWVDHATGERGDVLTLWAAVHGIHASDFARLLTECEAWLGGSPTPTAARHREIETSRPIEPEPTREVEQVWTYRSVTGAKICEVRRYRLSDGRKDYRPYTSGAPGMPTPRPLYNLHRWLPEDTIVLVEGEKCADALVSIGVEATTAMGGAKALFDKTDWSPLAGKTVLLWPDNDAPGRDYMTAVAPKLAALGCKTRVLAIPASAPEKWDAADAVEAGFDVVGFLRQGLEALETTPDQGELHGLWIDELDYAYQPELVEGLIPASGVGVIYGPSSSGKTFVAVDMCIRIAAGRSVMDRYTDQGGVLYFAAEGHAGLRKRLVAARACHGLNRTPLPFNYLPAFLDLSRAETGDVERLMTYAEQISEAMEARGARLRMVVVDTLAAAAPSADENVSRDMGPVMLAFHKMAARLDCVVLLVAHTGKDVSRGLRGWSGIRANVDFAIECRAEKDELTGETNRRSLWFEKAKDGPDGFVLSDYVLLAVVMGEKPSGAVDTTCRVDFVPPPRAPDPAVSAREAEDRDARKLQELKEEVFDAIVECLSEHWKPLRETSEILKHQGGVSMGRDALQGYLSTFATDAPEGVSQHHWKGCVIEIMSTPKAGRIFRELRVLRDE